MHSLFCLLLVSLLFTDPVTTVSSPSDPDPDTPLVTVIDLDPGETVETRLSDGSTAVVELLDVETHRDPVFNTLTGASIEVIINGVQSHLKMGNYQLPVEIGGLQADVPAIDAYLEDAGSDFWKLDKSVRIRLWPGDSPWIDPDSFTWPVKQRWFASRTWFSNEPISPRTEGQVYYHAGMDIGGAEGLTEVVAATDGVVLSLGEELAEGEPHPAVRERYDVIYIKDRRGWIYRYSHLKSFDPGLDVGNRVEQGQRLGYIGKEGASGGWSHLHFHIESLQPSGEWGHQDSYAFLWQSYLNEYAPPIMAVARPHRKALVGEQVTLDASRSWAETEIESYEWTFHDGSQTEGAAARKIYERPGTYSEMVRVRDADGNVDYDFTRVNVYPERQSESEETLALLIHGVHAVHHPTLDIRPGDPVVFQSRGRRTGPGEDIFDFGDGSPKVAVPTNLDDDEHATNGYGTVVHHYDEPGHYIVRIERRDAETGFTAIENLHVVVDREEQNTDRLRQMERHPEWDEPQDSPTASR